MDLCNSLIMQWLIKHIDFNCIQFVVVTYLLQLLRNHVMQVVVWK